MTTNHVPIIRTVAEVRNQITDWKNQGFTIALVPTMGALHRAHLSLVDIAAQHADKVIVSIFVNPTQFAPQEDFDRYPKDEKADAESLSTTQTALIYAPLDSEMYPSPSLTSLSVASLSEGLCSNSRPHFFGGVSLVVTKLFMQVQPDIAVFGEKDFQQLQIIRQLVRDLDIPVDIVSGPTVREDDGLAMSSRNKYLQPDERLVAGQLNKILRKTARSVIDGAPIDETLLDAEKRLIMAGFDKVDYLELRASETLLPITRLTQEARLLVAVHIGKTRLLDNCPVVQ